MAVDTKTPDAAYLTKTNIVHMDHTLNPSAAHQAQANLRVAEAETRARADLSAVLGATVSAGSIQRGK